MGLFDKVTTALITVSAVAVAALLAKRELLPTAGARASSVVHASPEFEERWEELLPPARALNATTGDVKIVAFADFECPFCQRFDSLMHRVADRYPGRVSLYHVHHPLSFHRFARITAIASECAHEQGRFVDFARVLYRKQDSLGLKSFGAYGHEAGVRDTTALLRCLSDVAKARLLDSLTAIGQRFGVRGTPTVLVNGWRYPEPPSEEVLARKVDSLLRRPSEPGER
jgi:protein-disulfide isomerase